MARFIYNSLELDPDKLRAVFCDEAEAHSYFDQLVDVEYLQPTALRKPLSLWNITTGKMIQSFDPTTDTMDNTIAAINLGDKRLGLIFRALTPGEREMVEDALKAAAMQIETTEAQRALQVAIDKMNAEHDDNQVLNDLKDAVRDPRGVSNSLRVIASFIRRNHVVIHTLVDFPHQA